MNDSAFAAQVRSEEVSDHEQRKAELKREAEHLNECASDAFESSGWPRSITLDCGCEVSVKRVDDGMESWWTERDWTPCTTHEELPL
jgi:hypothetical protein